MKLKMIFNPPPEAPFGTRPETHFIKISNQCWREIEQLAVTEGISLEETVHLILREGLNAASESRTKQSLKEAQMVTIAVEVFGSEEAANRWMSSPNRALGGVVPQSLCDSDEGCEEVEAILRRIEQGEFS